MSTTPDRIDQTVTIHTKLTANEVRAFRKARGITQAALAVKLDVSKRAIEVWESDDGPRAPYWVRLAFATIAAGLKPWDGD